MIKSGITKRFAEVGKIKIGGLGEHRKTKEGKDFRLPIRYEHFVVTTTEKNKDGNFIPNKNIMSKLGEQPKEIPIRLPFDSIDLNFFTSFQYYHGKKCVCHGDGETALRTNDKGVESKINCEPNTCEYLKAEKCKVSGILSCHIPITMEIGGIYRFRTHSWNSVSSILAALEYFSENTRGVLQGLPLKLKFLKKATAEHGNVNIVTVVLDGIELMRMRELAYQEFENRTKLGIDMKMLEHQAEASGFLVDTDDSADVEDEFYNETDNKPTVDADTVKPGAGVTAAETADKLKDEKPKTEPKPEQGSLL